MKRAQNLAACPSAEAEASAQRSPASPGGVRGREGTSCPSESPPCRRAQRSSVRLGGSGGMGTRRMGGNGGLGTRRMTHVALEKVR